MTLAEIPRFASPGRAGRRPRVLTWHVHGSYLYYLAQAPIDLYLPVRPDREAGYAGRTPSYPWPDTVHEVPAEAVPDLDLDLVVFQSRQSWEVDQHQVLSPAQRRLPRIYLEHDPPREHPTDTRHPVDDPDVLLVHVTPFNDLMWDAGRTPTRVVEHGVVVPGNLRYDGELERGIVVVNGLDWRGRRLGADVVERVREQLPLDVAGIGSEKIGGLGPLSRDELFAAQVRYRFFFNPIRYTSLGLAVCEAMMLGVPVVGFATTEMATVVRDGVNGRADTNLGRLMSAMQTLLEDPAEARRLGEAGRRTALRRFGIERFVDDWMAAIGDVTGIPTGGARVAAVAAERSA